MYLPKHFVIQELIPKSLYQEKGDWCWCLLNPWMLITLDQLRERYGILVVNNWLWGGYYEESGLRTPDCKCYSETSQHSRGCAADCKFKDIDAESVRQDVIQHKDDFPHITFIELDTDWFHFDVRNAPRLTLWSPETGKSRIC